MSDKLKVITMYLPQYHRIIENDTWWGDGYTDWVAVKQAEKYFPEQTQPRVPLNNNYYDLSQPSVLRWQADLMKKYNVYGQCFYHYYFKDGRKVLERPAEILLNNTDINMPFCFCWANDSWARSWSKISNTNQWAEKFEMQSGRSILLEQDYGNEEDWKKHFEYLRDFFVDDRYIKIDGKPLFIIYRPEAIECLSEMIDVFNEESKKCGFPGICFWGANLSTKLSKLDAILFIHASAYFNANITGKYLDEKRINNVKTYVYDDVWKNILSTNAVSGIRTYYGGIVDQDDTPRRGKLGFCLTGVTPEKFGEYLFGLAVKNMAAGNEFLFIDAWNEWGEGNYLEPDRNNGYKYLEHVSEVVKACNVEGFDAQAQWDKLKEKESDCEQTGVVKQLNKYKSYFGILDKWLLLKEHNISLSQYLISHEYRRIAIYGFMALGNHLYKELEHSEVEIKAIIDRRDELVVPGIQLLGMESMIPKIDAVIVTPIYDFDVIKEELQKRTDAKIISIENLINGCICMLDE